MLSTVGDIYIRLIPTDPGWQPTTEAADTAVRYVRELFAGPGDAVERVEHVFYDSVTLIDAWTEPTTDQKVGGSNPFGRAIPEQRKQPRPVDHDRP
jgi:hypothetical protein